MSETRIDERIDLRGVLCPMNYVKTKLKLEEMKSGQVLEVIIDDGDAVNNVPRSIKEEGHKIIDVEKMDDAFKLVVVRV